MDSSYSLWRILKVAAAVVFAFVLSAGNMSGQNANVTLNARNTSIENALGMLKSNYGYSFIMQTDGLDLSRRVDVSVRNVTVEAAVKKLFLPTPVSVEVKKSMV